MTSRRTRPGSAGWLFGLGLLACSLLAGPLLPGNANAVPFYLLLLVDAPYEIADQGASPDASPLAFVPVDLRTLLAESVYQPLGAWSPSPASPAQETDEAALASYRAIEGGWALPTPSLPSSGAGDEVDSWLADLRGGFEPVEPPNVVIRPGLRPSTTAPVPEPGAAMLFMTGLLVGGAARRLGRRPPLG